MMKKLQLLLLLLMASLTGLAADNTQQFLPSNWGNWQNLTYGVADNTEWTTDHKPLEVQISGNVIHVAWMEQAKQNDDTYALFYRRSLDNGKTWEKARVIARNEKDTWTYYGGGNSHWMQVDGQNVHFALPFGSNEGKHTFNYVRSTDGGATFTTKVLWETTVGYIDARLAQVASDGQTVVLATNIDGDDPYVWTSFDGGNTFKQTKIAEDFLIVDLKVSGKRWSLLGYKDSGSAYDRWSRVFFSTSTDGGGTVSTENLAYAAANGKTYSTINYLGSPSFAYHPQMVVQGDIIDLMFVGSLSNGNEGDPDPGYDKNHTIHRRSTDGGKTWSEARYLPESTGKHGTIAAKGSNVYVYTTYKGKHAVYHSHDGGKSWDVQQQGVLFNSDDEWNATYSFNLYIAPDDANGQHVYLTGSRAFLAESKDGFRTLCRNFVMGKETWPWDGGSCIRNNSLIVLLDNQGTEQWFMWYRPPYSSNKYFWTVCHRRNDPAANTGSTDMALNITNLRNEYNQLMASHQVIVPMTPSIHEIKKATTIECWVRPDSITVFQIASLTHNTEYSEGTIYRGGWSIRIEDDHTRHFVVTATMTTEQIIDGVGTRLGSGYSDRYRIYDTGYWHHVAMTYDAAEEKDNLRLYVDGMLYTVATLKGDILQGDNPIVIGDYNGYNTSNALLDNFAIWDRALSQEELRSHIYQAPTGKEQGCRLLLTFDGSLKDQSAYHNDGMAMKELVLTPHDGIRAPHPQFIASKDLTGRYVNLSDATEDGEVCWWVKPYPYYINQGKNYYVVDGAYKTSTKPHEQIDFDKYSGLFPVNMVVRPKGNCNAYASAEQIVTIGGLSKVFPEESAQSKGVRLRIQGGYNLTYSKQPKVVLKQGSNEIEGKWLIKYGYDMSKVVRTADDLPEALFDMSTASLGKYDVIVGSDTLSQAFTLTSEGEEPDVWMEISGREKSLYNKWQLYTINYGNRANVGAYNTPIFIFISDKLNDVDVSFDFNYIVTNPNFDENMQAISNAIGEYTKIADQNGDSLRCYSFVIPYIAPNSSNQRTFRIRHRLLDNPTWNPEVEIVYAMESPWGALDPDGPNPFEGMSSSRMKGASGLRNINPDLAWCLVRTIGQGMIDLGVALVPGTSCGWAGIKMAAQPFIEEEYDWWSFTSSLIALGVGCSEDVVKTWAWGPYAAYKVAEFCWNTYCNVRTNRACLDADAQKKKTKTVGSYDPNEMIGPSGYDDQVHYIKPIHQMPYTITFENKSSATAPAHEVFVTDVLDASKYDFSTFSFTGYGWAEQSYTVGGGRTKEFTRDITYNVKGQDILVRVSGQFDEKTGIIHWSFVSLKKNGDEIEDPDLGFLVPNNDNRDGEGFVSFIIEHKANPANGSTISNKATIIFDANDPIVTNTYVNTFDIDYPSSQITKVEEKDGKLVVTVSGSDATSGIGSYQVYAFKNGGKAELVAVITEGNQATFACDSGTKYGLCVIATDNVGWNEPKDIKAETEVTTSGTGINSILMDDPANSEFIDMQGRRLKGPKTSGIYIQNKKKVYIKKLVKDETE